MSEAFALDWLEEDQLAHARDDARYALASLLLDEPTPHELAELVGLALQGIPDQFGEDVQRFFRGCVVMRGAPLPNRFALAHPRAQA